MNRFIILSLACALSVSAFAQTKKEEVMTKAKDVYTINTTTLCDLKGYKGPVPLQITVKKDKIVSVEALANKETPKFFRKINDQMLAKYAGKKFADYEKVDGVTGATMSSKAVKAGMKAAYDYYQANK